ncbi:MAG: type II toxin-antitoxin system VapC family toxin [Candidatus Schekmanbacteria bacterium]|nr:type II toxin-antitoxin system VapC family toxin [Candidatus Schekmanbacteria bacterium]
MKGFVLDSYALIAFFEDEPGALKVEQILKQAESGKVNLLMSMVNWGEVYYSIYRSKGEDKAEESLLIIEQLPIKLIDIDQSLMYQAATLKAKHAIALGDCIASAIAINIDYPVVTGDKEFKKLGSRVKIEWIP